MCAALHNKYAQFDAFKICQMLEKQKINNSCRTLKTFLKASCCFCQQNEFLELLEPLQ